MEGRRKVLLWRAALLIAAVGLVAIPASGAQTGTPGTAFLQRASQVVALRYYLQHPDRAPATMQPRIRAAITYAARLQDAHARGVTFGAAPPFGDRLNDDVFGLPENEESVAQCTASTGDNVAIEGTNDYRGILNDVFNFTGWHLSVDGGQSLAKEGLLPEAGGLASSGDPAFRADGDCNLFAANLNFNVFDPTTAGTSGIGVYRSDESTLLSDATCDTSQEPFHSDPNCWPIRALVATNAAGHFLDKEWVSVGDTGDGEHVWVTWSDFDCSIDPSCSTNFTARIMASRCAVDFSSCSTPQALSGNAKDIQFSYSTVGPDGRTYVSWVHVFGELTGDPQQFVLNMRVAEPGSLRFGPTQTVAKITTPLPFGGLLNANNFRIASVPKNTVKLVNGTPRVFAVYDECAQRPLDTICENAEIHLAYSDDSGATWTDQVVSAGGQNYFPAIANDTSNGHIVVAYYTNRFDPQFQSLQDVELLTIDAASGAVVNRQRVTTATSNNTDADWTFSSGFIGDYIDIDASAGTAYVGYNANLHNVKVFGDEGVPVPQQDNFLSVLAE